MAYLGRYATQTQADVAAMTMREINLLTAEVGKIIEEENRPSPSGGGGGGSE